MLPESDLLILPLFGAALTICFSVVALFTNPRRGINQAVGLVGAWLASMLVLGALSYIQPSLFVDRAHHVAMGACLLSVVVLMHCVLDHPTSVRRVLRQRWWLVAVWFGLLIPGLAPGVVMERNAGGGISTSLYYNFHVAAYAMVVAAAFLAWQFARKRAAGTTVEVLILGRASVFGLGVILALITCHIWLPQFVDEAMFLGHGILVIGFCGYIVLSTSHVILGKRELGRVLLFATVVFFSFIGLSWAILTVTTETSHFVQAGTIGTVCAVLVTAGALLLYARQPMAFSDSRALHALAALFEKHPTSSALLAAAERVVSDWAHAPSRIWVTDSVGSTTGMSSNAIAHLLAAKWATPESLDRSGQENSDLGDFLRQNDFGLIVMACMGEARLVIALGKKTGVDQFGFSDAVFAQFLAMDLLNAVERLRIAALQRERESNEFIEAMSATLAHQLRTPLLNVAGLLHAYTLPGISAARLEEMNFKIREDLDAAAATLEKMMKIRTKRAPVMKDVALSEFLHQIRGTFREKMRTYRTHCTCEIPADLPTTIRTDEAAITTILEVFIENALQAFPASQTFRAITLTASVDRRWVAITVSDNGPGIPAAAKAGLFRVMRSTKLRGAGFGLAGASQSARSIGGELECQSPGTLGGASMTLRVPIE